MPMMPCRLQREVWAAQQAANGSASHGLCIVSVHWPEDMDAGGAVRQLRGGAEEGGREDGRDLGRINWGAAYEEAMSVPIFAYTIGFKR